MMKKYDDNNRLMTKVFRFVSKIDRFKYFN